MLSIGSIFLLLPDEAPSLWIMIVEKEACSKNEPTCHGYFRRPPQNETLFGDPDEVFRLQLVGKTEGRAGLNISNAVFTRHGNPTIRPNSEGVSV